MEQENFDVAMQKFERIEHSGQPALQLVLPPECNDLENVSCSDEYDLAVPDLRVILYLPSLITALKVLHQHPDALHHAGAKCWVDSDGYEGKIRLEFVKVYAHAFSGNWNHSFFLNFSNDWTGSVYFLDLRVYLHNLLGGYDDIVAKLEKLAANV